MKKKGIIVICSFLVSAIMIFNMVAVNVFAEETVPLVQEETLQETLPAQDGAEVSPDTFEIEDLYSEPDNAGLQSEQEVLDPEGAAAQENTAVSLEEVTIDSVKIRVSAPEGVFPQDAKVVAEKVSEKEEKKAADAIDDIRSKNSNVADSYTFDIKVVDALGNELELADGQKVNVSFELDRAEDKNLTADIYHISEKELTEEEAKALKEKKEKEAEETEAESKTEIIDPEEPEEDSSKLQKVIFTAEKLDTKTNLGEASVTAETDSFSIYTVEFTYGNLQYVLSGGETVPLNEILSAVGLTGEVTTATASAPELFTVSGESGEWLVTSLQAFHTKEWLKVTIQDVEYQITVTDDSDVITVSDWGQLQEAINTVGDGQTIILSENITAGSDNGTLAVVRSGISFTIDLAGHVISRNLTEEDEDNNGHVFDVNQGTLTIKDSSTEQTGTITGGFDENGGGIVIGGEGHLIFESGTITGNAAENGGGIFNYGQLIMKGGAVTGNAGGDCGGIFNHEGTMELSNVTISNNSTWGAGGAGINNRGTGTVTSCTISGNNAVAQGGGIYNDSNGNLTIDASTITGNHSDANGGAVCSYGNLTINNCSLNNNTAGNEGGGVYVNQGWFIMNGGSVSGNTSIDGGGVFNENGSLHFDGVTLSGNTATKFGGGGINNKKEATIRNCTISNNNAALDGGGIYSEENITVENCTLENNTTQTSGGALRIYDSTAYLYGCILNGNSALLYGGGVCAENNGYLSLEGGNITNNIGYEGGGGVWVGGDSGIGISGVINVTDNTASGIYLAEGRVINITGSLRNDTSSSKIGVVLAKQGGVFTSGYQENNSGVDPYNFFVPETGCSVVMNGNEAEITLSMWGHLQYLINTAKENDVISLDRNISAQPGDKTLTVPEGKILTIDLKGFTLDRELGAYTEDGEVFTVKGTLTIKDSVGGGKISGGFGGGGGVVIYPAGVFTLEGGSISNNIGNLNGGGILILEGGSATIKHDSGSISGGKVEHNIAPKGGGIYSAGTLTIESGSGISHNFADENGGGIFIASGAMTINGGNLSSNYAGYGGGVYLAGGTLNFQGGTITSNTASNDGGGIWDGSEAGAAVLNAQGTPVVTGNTANTGHNLLLKNGNVINITGPLTVSGGTGENAMIDLVTDNSSAPITSGLSDQSGEETAREIFTYDNKSFSSSLEVREKELYHLPVSIDVTVDSWSALQNAINAAEYQGKTIGLSTDVTAGEDDESLMVEGKNVIIDLNGYTINRNLDDCSDDGTVFDVDEGSSLTIRDSVGTGEITGGYEDDNGGAFYISEGCTVTIESGTIKGNKAESDGGAFYVAGTLIMTGGTINANESEDTGGAIFCADSGTFSLSNVVISNNVSENDGGALCIHLSRDATIKNCQILNNQSRSEDGGAFRLEADDRTLLIEDTRINGNSACNDGGAIVIYDGSVVMNGGSVSDNAADNGGGVLNENGTILFTGVEICGNISRKNSGGGINNQNEATLKNCVISNNKASEDAGGGVYNKANLIMEDCTLSGNNAGSKGGGVFTKDKATITGSSFDSNKAKEGGAIYQGGTNTNLTNCVMTKNESEENGGAIKLDDGSMTIDGGSITDNKASGLGSGIFVDADLMIQGTLEVSDNERDNIYLTSDEMLSISGSLRNGDQLSKVGVSLEDDTGTFTEGFKSTNPDEDPADCFSSDRGYSVIRDENGDGLLVPSEWPKLQKMVNDTASTDDGSGDIPVLTIEKDWVAADSDVMLTLPAGKRLIIDLKGHTLNRNCKSQNANGQTFQVDNGCSLTIRDSSEAKTGMIKGGFADNGGAVNIQPGGSCRIESGIFTGNKAVNGGAVFVHSGGSLTVTGGSFYSNEASYGGGIYLAEGTNDPAAAEFTSCILTGNRASVEGGGIWVGQTALLNVSGMPFVKGNAGSAGKNILLAAGNVLHITGTLTVGSGNADTIDGAGLDLAAKNVSGAGSGAKLTEGLTATVPEGSSPEEYAKAIFTYDEMSYDSTLMIFEDELYHNMVNADIWVSDWAALQNAINDEANQGKVIGLAGDITASEDDDRLLHENGWTVAVDLNGHKVDRALDDNSSDGHVFEISDGATLIIKDSVGTGIITGGYADDGGGIYVDEDSKCVIEGGTICNNKADSDGGGIYVCGTLEMTGGAVSNNYADDTAGGIYCDDNGTFSLSNVTISGNSAENDGGGLIVHLDSDASISNSHIMNNRSNSEDGGAMRVEAKDHTLNITDTEISGNWAENDGGGIVIYAGRVVMTGGTISGNTSEDGGGVYNDDGSMEFTGVTISGNTATKNEGAGICNKKMAALKDCKITGNIGQSSGGGIYTEAPMSIEDGEISDNRTAGEGGGIYNTEDGTTISGTVISRNRAEGDGGGIFTKEDISLSACQLEGNNTNSSGGAISARDCSVYIANCSVKDNESTWYGGGIFTDDDAEMTLDGGTISGNSAGQEGGGIFVGDETEHCYIKGGIIASDNIGGSDIYLDKDQLLEVAGPLVSETEAGSVNANMGVVTLTGLDQVFTASYSEHNKQNEEVIDPSTYFFSDEGYEVYLNGTEAAFRQAPVDHSTPFISAGTQIEPDYNKLSGKDWMSGISGERYLYEINMPGTHDTCTKEMVGNVSTGYLSLIAEGVGLVIGSLLTLSVFGGLVAGSTLPLLASEYAATFAETQRRYIDEQLDDGVRMLDLRICNYYAEPGYLGSIEDNGKDVWILHGEESIPGSFFALKSDGDFLSLQDVLNYCKDFLKEHPTETLLLNADIQGIDVDEEETLTRLNQHIRNLSQEINPSTGKSYLYTENGDYLAVLSRYPQLKDCRGQIIMMGKSVGNGSGGLIKGAGIANVYSPAGDYKDNAEMKIKHLTDFYSAYGFDPIPEDGNNGQPTLDYYISAGTNGTDDKMIPTITPLDIADDVLPVLFDEGGLLTDRQSKYIGLVNMDGANAKVNRQVWITNFGTLKYCTVTVKSSEDDPEPLTYTVLKNTPIPIPDCIFTEPNSNGDYFKYWKAEWEDGNDICYPHDQFTVTGDITFTAMWELTDKSSVHAEWNDGGNADGIRPNKLVVKVTRAAAEGDPEGQPVTEDIVLSAADKAWRVDLDYSVVKVEPVCPEKYTAEVQGTRIVLTHIPEKSVWAAGEVIWRDAQNIEGKRPDSVELSLYENGEQTKQLTVSAEDGWIFDLGKLRLFDDDIRRITYLLTQSDVEDYSTYVSGLGTDGIDAGFEVINTLKSSNSLLTGVILWANDLADPGQRPDQVTVHLLANGTEVDSRTVVPDSGGNWIFEFALRQKIPYSGYLITVDPIDGYTSTVNMGDINGDVVFVINKAVNHEHVIQEFSGDVTEPTCEEPGLRLIVEFCATCGDVISQRTEIIDPLGHSWGKWNTKKTATETETGIEERVCVRDPKHTESRVIPCTAHVHTPVKVEAKAATCTTAGNIDYYYCEGCGWYFLDGAHPVTTWIASGEEIIPALGHDFGDWTVVKEPTETENGLEERVCSRDPQHIESREIPPAGHIHQLSKEEAKAASCTEEGRSEYWVCDGGEHPCGLYFSDSEGTEQISPQEVTVPALGHDWGRWRTTKPSTQTETGLEERVCYRDPSHIEEREIPIDQHIHEPVRVMKKAPTCTEDGNKTYYYCNGCSWYFLDAAHPGTTWIAHGDEVIPATGHDWGEWIVTKEATETEPGMEIRLCRNFSFHVEAQEIPVIAHTHQLSTVEAKAATCTEEGNIEYWICDKGGHPCGLYFSDSEGNNQIDPKDVIVPATGHDWNEWETEKPATQEEEGLEKRTCKHDPTHTEERTSPRVLHIHDPIFVPGNAPTCTVDGNKAYYYCEGCGWYFLDGAHPGTTWIAHGEEVLPALGHDWGAWTVVKEATETETGLEERVCSHDPAHTENRVVPVILHQHHPVKVEAKVATCTEDGNIAYYYCEGCGWYFTDGAHPGTTWIAHGDEILPAIGHNWGEPVYEWREDNSTCTGKRICSHDASHVIEETVMTTSEVVKEPTADEPGERVYTAVFEDTDNFKTQTKTELIPPLGSFMITFDLNGGNYNGNTDNVVIFAAGGDVITIPEAPEKEGYNFLYWKGSEYYPGDQYTVTGDHTMTAQWEAVPEPGDKDKKGDDVPTGDSNKPLVWIVTMLSGLLAVSVLATAYTGRRRRNDHAKGRSHDQK